MNSFIYQLLFFIVIYIKSTYNFPDGAPSAACATMIPRHNVSSQQCSTKYRVQSDKLQYYTDETVRIIVNGSTSSDTFKGILLIAKTQNSGQIIGNWTVVSSTIKTLNCSRIANTGVTHTSNIDKSSIEAIWSPPSTISLENTVIKATVVTSYSDIYVDCFSITLTNRQTNIGVGDTSTISPSTTVVATTSTVPQTSDIGVNISWTYNNGVTAVKMRVNNLKTSQWFALGLSLDQNMGDDHVFICQRLANDTITIGRYINPGGHSPPQLASTSSGGTFNPTLARLDNSLASCEFTLSNFGSSKRRRRAISLLSQSIPYYPLLAIGNLDSSNELIQHTFRTALSQNVQLNQQEIIVYNINSTTSNRIGLIKAHGILMIFTWILFVSTGILVALFFKPSWPDHKLCGKPIWFSIHRTLMITVVILTITAFILILVYENGRWVSQTTQREFAHSIIGIIIISFTIIQPIMALFRCKPDGEYRFIFNYLHGFVGLSAFILSIVAIFLAMFFKQFNFQTNNEWGILVAWTCWLPIIFFSFWFIEYYFGKNRLNKTDTDSYDLGGNSTPKDEQIQTINHTKKDRIKLVFLIIHILVALSLALALVILLGTM